MVLKREHSELVKRLTKERNILLVQDIDGVCIPLVKNPLTRRLDLNYIYSANSLSDEFVVLTNGEHEGYRGVNRIVEEALGNKSKAKKHGFYLPGLAAGGVELQDKYGNISYPGVNSREISFLKDVPLLLKELFKTELIKANIIADEEENNNTIDNSVLDTRFTPTLNLNHIFDLSGKDYIKKISIQKKALIVMEKIIDKANNQGLGESFYLHIAPNNGKYKSKEQIKFSSEEDIGTTDIQFMLSGALKETGLLVLLNEYINKREGYKPFGEKFNARKAPRLIKELKTICLDNIPKEHMPLIIGVGDTVTSNKIESRDEYLRGGSDRGFLTLIQEIGKSYQLNNKVIFVDSNDGEVQRPTTKDGSMKGISDPKDNLKFDIIFKNGTPEYREWFEALSIARIKFR